jgi:AcrR family transcriptional regulator
MTQPPDSTSPSETTRQALIAAATALFGQKGFAATSTREIAAASGANIAAIAYHFGGKEGLRQACVLSFAERMAKVLATAPDTPDLTPDLARNLMQMIARNMLAQLLGDPQTQLSVAFVLREIAEDGAGAQVLYDNLVGPAHRRICGLMAAASGQSAEDPALQLRVFTLIGQALYFRVGGPIVRRRMGWQMIGPAEITQITEVVLANIDAMILVQKGL